MTHEGAKNAATQAKSRWNDRNYTQVKAHVDPDVASDFKKACAANGVSMASALTQLMAEYRGTVKKRKPSPDYSTRRQRRAAVNRFVQQLELIMAAEERVRDNTPENLQGAATYEETGEIASMLEAAIDSLNSIY